MRLDRHFRLELVLHPQQFRFRPRLIFVLSCASRAFAPEGVSLAMQMFGVGRWTDEQRIWWFAAPWHEKRRVFFEQFGPPCRTCQRLGDWYGAVDGLGFQCIDCMAMYFPAIDGCPEALALIASCLDPRGRMWQIGDPET